MQILLKIQPAGAELFHTDGQTYMTKLIVAFRNSVKAKELPASQNNNKPLTDLCMHARTRTRAHKSQEAVQKSK